MAEMIEQRALAVPARRSIRLGVFFERLLLVAALGAVWWVLSLSAPPYVLPGPGRVWSALGIIAAHGDLWANLGITFWRVALGFVFATIVGLPFGIVLGANRRMGEFFEPVVPVLNTVSSAIWAIFAIIWFGISNATTVFVVFMTAMPLIMTNVWQGTRAVNADFIELARVLRMPDWKIMAKIYLPTILPYFFSGPRLAFGFGWAASVGAEAIGWARAGGGCCRGSRGICFAGKRKRERDGGWRNSNCAKPLCRRRSCDQPIEGKQNLSRLQRRPARSAEGHRPRRQGPRDRRPARRFGRGQEHAAQHHRRHRQARPRPHLHLRLAERRAERLVRGELHVPGRPAAPVAHGAAQRRVRARSGIDAEGRTRAPLR